LGYIVSTFTRKTAGNAWGMSVVVQSSVALPTTLEERCEEWLKVFRKELEAMSPDAMATEASAIVAQLLETETKMSQEVNRVWGDILNTEGLVDRMRTPAFDRLQNLAEQLTVADDDTDVLDSRGKPLKTAEELKQKVLSFFDEHLAADAPQRRAMSSRVYRHESKADYEAALKEPGVLSTFEDMRHLKQYLSSWPTVPYWRIDNVFQKAT
jgi:secreted Zn-dependent insulinase-like peptidase